MHQIGGVRRREGAETELLHQRDGQADRHRPDPRESHRRLRPLHELPYNNIRAVIADAVIVNYRMMLELARARDRAGFAATLPASPRRGQPRREHLDRDRTVQPSCVA